MSFSFSRTDYDADTALFEIAADTQLPSTVKGYMIDGIKALQKLHGNSINVNITAYGHLFNGQAGWSEVTTATITVSQAVAKEIE